MKPSDDSSLAAALHGGLGAAHEPVAEHRGGFAAQRFWRRMAGDSAIDSATREKFRSGKEARGHRGESRILYYFLSRGVGG